MMKKYIFAVIFCLITFTLPAASQNGQVAADRDLLAEIYKIKAIDNHAHPLAAMRGGEIDVEEDYSQAAEPFDVPVRLRPDNPEYKGARRELYGDAFDESRLKAADYLAAKQLFISKKDEGFPVWVLDRLGIDVMLSNRIAMGRGLNSPRFLWVPFADPLIFPLDNRVASATNPDYLSHYKGAEKILARYLKESGVSAVPPTLDAYLKRVLTPTLERQKKQGAVALKFGVAYQRTLDFADTPIAEASRVFARYRNGVPPAKDYKALQDFLFRYIVREAGRLGIVVHVHVGAGASGYFDQGGANPFILEPVLNDPKLRGTKIVLIHGGSPFAQETRMLLYKPNVYADFSAQTFLLSTRELSTVLRSWLEFVPEKVLFGTDAFELMPEVNWADHASLTVTSARRALAIALTGMMQDGQISRDRALELARMVLRENAAKLYGFKSK